MYVLAVSLGGFGRLDNLQGFGRLDHCGANVLLTESVNSMPCKRALATDLIAASHACKQPLLQRAASAPEMPVPSDKVLICTRNLAPDIRGTIHALLPACAPHHKYTSRSFAIATGRGLTHVLRVRPCAVRCCAW